jgi:hypothetical protein
VMTAISGHILYPFPALAQATPKARNPCTVATDSR